MLKIKKLLQSCGFTVLGLMSQHGKLVEHGQSDASIFVFFHHPLAQKKIL
jgi:hypothetical protein